MARFDPLETKDRIELANAIKELPAATAQEIETRFDRTKGNWDQGQHPTYIRPGDLEDHLQRVFRELSPEYDQSCTYLPTLYTVLFLLKYTIHLIELECLSLTRLCQSAKMR